ncbi:TonB-dependent receptor domain-containing protein [Kordiimonas pumila]|uniref:TonB-dependent receptor domain-containing protein n=1 Tax=Kordiimonas pumila TaxID=2161677 RepID=A0ABV7D0Y3_9PROT|nr:TonB-dependent receptor [Kordiimonas pumila]
MKKLRKFSAVSLAAISIALGAASVQAVQTKQSIPLNMQQQPLMTALQNLSSEYGIQIASFSEDVAGKTVGTLSGNYTLTSALSAVLKDSGLRYIQVDDRTIAVGTLARLTDQYSSSSIQTIAFNTAADYEEGLAVSDDDESMDTVTNSHIQFEEIMVTATRRSTGVQTTALTISAFGGEELEKKGYNSISQFIDTVPGVTATTEGPNRNRVIIRNIATSTQESGSSTIATYFDDFALSAVSGGAAEIRLVDMERVEVLKGPQGTLFGRSAMGGIVRYISNKPDPKEFAAGFDMYLSDVNDGGENYGGHGYVNVPLSDKMALRAVGYYYDNAGFIDNVELGNKDANDEETYGGRLAFHWDITDKFSTDLTYLYQKIDAGASFVTTTRDPGDLSIAGDEGPDIPFDVEARTGIGGIDRRHTDSQEFLNLKLEYDFDAFITTLLATRNTLKTGFAFDQREFVDIRSGCVCDYLDPDSGRVSGDAQTDILELRLVSSNDTKINWILGAYYEDSDTLANQLITYYGPTQYLYGFIPILDGEETIDYTATAHSNEKAVYAEVGMDLTAKTSFKVGYRRSHIKYDTIDLKQEGSFVVLTGADALLGIPFETKENVNTYKFSLEHQINDDIFAYALATSGYRRGGFNKPTIISPFSTYNSDSLWNYELGLKTKWFDGRLVANLSAYLIEYTDIQLVVQDPVTFARSTQNAGKAEIPGIELSLAYQVNNYLDIAFNGSLSDPKLKEDVPGGVTGKKGDRLPGSAKENFSVSLNWESPIFSQHTLFSNLTYKYTGERYNDFNLDLDIALPSYDLVDFQIGLRSDEGYSVSLFAHNLFDEAYIGYIDRQGTSFESASTNTPRTIGLRLKYDF